MKEAATANRAGLCSVDERYRLLRLVGQGGMGEIWETEDTVLGRRVALKLPRSGHSSFDSDRWLAAEAQTVVRLSHPSLVALLDRTLVVEDGVPDPHPGLVFEFVEGRPLGLWVDRPRPWRWVRAIIEQMLHGLAYAHGRGVVHRDLKPSNVLLSGDPVAPRVHLLDFGIAALTAPGRAGDSLGSSAGLVAGLVAPGTKAYMAPEQLEGERGDIGPWTDIYSLGVVISELLLGRLPFEGSNDAEVWSNRLRHRFSPPARALSELGIPLRRWLLRMLAPDPAHRFGWAADALRVLPAVSVADLAGGEMGALPSPEATDMMMEVAARAEDRDTDPDFRAGKDAAVVTHGSGTLEIAPAEAGEVVLPPSWAVDRPAEAAWEHGLGKVPSEPQPTVPAASYGLLSMRESPLCGRDAVWREAWEHLRQASEQRKPVLLLIEGPQGRGKTRFARELAAVAEEVGVARSHHVRFRADGSGAGALRRLLHQILRISRLPQADREERVQRVLSEAGYPTEADLVPRLIAMLTPRQHPRGPALEEPATAIELLQVLGRRRPLLLWLEDIDRAEDRALSRWLTELFRSDQDLPIAVVATLRREPGVQEKGSDPEWTMLRAQARTLVLEMTPLSDEAVGSMLRFTAGVCDELGGEIARWSRGDPRAARQTARHLHESGRLRWSPDGYELRGDTPSTAGHLKLDSILAARARDALEASSDPEAMSMVFDLLALVRERSVHSHLIEAAARLGLEERRVDECLASLVMSDLVDVRDEGPRLAHTA
ncbi:MAG: protein kinase, partial [Myxococcota bacterium]|nr:protein kinase [Myxococcota bacterium]